MPFTAPQRPVDRVFLHCSASDRPEHDDVSVMRDWHVNGNGWSDVGYHFFIRKDGVVQEGRPPEQVPAAQAGHNTGSIAICLHGLAAERFTKAQYESLIALCREIHAACAGMVTFHGHCEVSAKACPVFPYRAVLGLDEHGGFAFAPSASPETADAGGPAAGARPAGEPVLRVTVRGPAVRRLQALLSRAGQTLEEDGIFGQNTLAAVKAFQRDAGLTVDGVVGPRSWAALHAAAGG